MDEPMGSLIEFLRQVGFLAEVSENAVEKIVTSLEVATIAPGEVLFAEGDRGDRLYLIWEGKLQVYKQNGSGQNLVLGEILSGQWVGEMQVLLGGKRTASVRTIEPGRLVIFSKPLVTQMTAQFASINEYFVGIVRQRLREQQVTALLSQLFGDLDSSCLRDLNARSQWLQIHRGERLCARGEPGDSIYFVLNGRFNTVIENEGGEVRVLGEITRGEAIGELSVLTGEPRSASVYALRDSVLIRYDREEFQEILEQYPLVLLEITQRIIARFKQREAGLKTRHSQVQSIAILAHDRKTPFRTFSRRFVEALSTHGSLLYLNRDRLAEMLEFPDAADLDPETPQGLRLQLWLEEQEQKYRFIVFEADMVDSVWTQRCIRQADRLVWVGLSWEDPSLTALEQQVRDRQTPATTLKETLVLLHREDTEYPSQTRRWLELRTLDLHHHVRWNSQPDIERVARFFAGCAVGVALGGGGGRGPAHVGILKALEEAGVPIDFIGGTSVGAMMASQYAMGWNPETMVEKNREGMNNNPFEAYTIPVVSLMSSHKLDDVLKSYYGDLDIEDLWLNYFCVSTNVSTGTKMVHRSGSLWKAMRSTTAVPGVFVPFINNGQLLTDGGACDNDPSLTLRELHSGPIVLSIVTLPPDLDIAFTYEEMPSAWEIFWSWVNPFTRSIEFPSAVELITTSATINSIRNRDESMSAADLVLVPPVQDYPVLDFKKFGELAQVGYDYAREKVEEWWTQKTRSPKME